MGNDLESGLHQWRMDGQFSNDISSKLPGMANLNIPSATPCTDAIPPNFGVTPFGLLPNMKRGQFGVTHGMFHHLPSFRHHEKILPNLDLPGKVSFTVDDTGIANGCAQKQFLVFDHTGDKTTMIYSSGIDIPNQQLNTWGSKPTYYNDTSRIDLNLPGSNIIKGLNEVYDTNEGSDMREDTEEINALLYSDNEDNCSDDGEETSTGHSPSTMTEYEKQDWYEEDMDEVASSSEPVKKQKLSDSGDEVPSVTNASSFVKPSRSWDYEDDAESSCGGGKLVQNNYNRVSLSGSKRHRKEKILETVSILQTVIPGVKGKDAVMVLDEAIKYLGLLKTNAISLGLSSR